MKFIYVLEDDIRVQREVFEALISIDPQLQVRFFLNLSEFHEWLKIAMTEGPLSLANNGHRHSLDTSDPSTPNATDELRLVIAKNEFLGTQHMGLIRRARDFFIRKKICNSEEPTAAILTAFDSPEFDIKLAEERIINNVIFKPFDKLILKQHLEYALSGRHPLESSATVATMKISSTIEMLKEIPFKSLSELGFKTVNNHKIEVGSIAKYYDSIFEVDSKRGLFAICSSCNELSPKEFLCEFLFVGADSPQAQKIRRYVLANKKHTLKNIENSQNGNVQILILDDDTKTVEDLQLLLKERFSNVETFCYTHLSQLQVDLEDKDTTHRQILPKSFDLVIANADAFADGGAAKWEQILQTFKDRCLRTQIPEKVPELILSSRQKKSADDIRNLLEWSKEVFFLPWDRLYVVKKLLTQWTSLTPKEPVTYAELEETGTFKVANPVSITQISEAGIILKYYRALGIGSFREFILWRPEEIDTPEIIGTCNFAEKEKGGDEFLNHFVFFGMKDHYLKHIRLWLREAYIKQKEK